MFNSATCKKLNYQIIFGYSGIIECHLKTWSDSLAFIYSPSIFGIVHKFLLYAVLDLNLVVSDLMFVLLFNILFIQTSGRDKIVMVFEKCSENPEG